MGEESEASSDPCSRASILIVDDDPAKRLALKAALTPLGYRVVEADSGVSALRSVLAEQFAVILLDVRMPTMDGFETASLLRRRKQSEMTPIIFITSSGTDEIPRANRFADGAVDFIFSPVEPAELRAKVAVFANLFVNAEELASEARTVKLSADHLQLVTDVAPVGIFQTDTRQRYLYTNPRWSEITGITQEDARGRRLAAVVVPNLRSELMNQLASSADQEEEFAFRFEIPSGERARRIAIMTMVPIPDKEGGTIGLIGTLADVTVEAQAEAAIEEARDAANSASQLKSDFLANMSHEIRTPMNGVIGMTELLMDTDLDERQRAYAETVRSSGEALLAIINDVLDFSKVEAGMLTLEEQEFYLPTVVEGVVDLMAAPAHAKNLGLVTSIDPSARHSVKGDAGRLRQILVNLIGNAVKFTRIGEVVVRVTSHRADDSEFTNIRIEVCDTGEGIPADKLETIFEPFVQADTSTSRTHGGTGLGLAISAHLISLMGGDFGASSHSEEGSRFWFTIRVRSVDKVSTMEASRHSVGLHGHSAIIIDGSASEREVLRAYLTEWGMNVDVASGMQDVAGNPVDVIGNHAPYSVSIVDRASLGRTGLESVGDGVGGGAQSIPLILMAEPGEERTLSRAEINECSMVMTKPVRIENLLNCLRVALNLEVAPRTPPSDVTGSVTSMGRKRTGRILLAEDNLVNQRVAIAMLSSVGYDVETVGSGTAAVSEAMANEYDVILMDCQMPGMNGYDATAAIRAHEGSGRHTPIVALTAGARTEDRDRCLAEGMDDYLSKPISKVDLLATVASYTEESHGWIKAPGPEIVGTPAAEVQMPIGVEDGRSVASPGSTGHDSMVADQLILDTTILDQLDQLGIRTGESLVEALTAQFLLDADVQMSELANAVATGDSDLLVRSAHQLRGASANMGAAGLAGLCATFDSQQVDRARAQDESVLASISSELVRVRNALHRRIASQ